MRDYLPLDSPVDAYVWNRATVCINPSAYFHHEAKNCHATILVAPWRNTRGEVRWAGAHSIAYGNGGRGGLPYCGPYRIGEGPTYPRSENVGYDSPEAAARHEIDLVLKHNVGAYYCNLSPAAIDLLQLELKKLSGEVAVQLALF